MSGSCALPFLYFSAEEVRQLVSMRDVIEEVAKGLQWFSAGEEGGVVQPVRTILHLKEHSGFFGIMPAYCHRSDGLGAKLLTYYRNAENGTPSHQAVLIMLDPANGTLLAIMEGNCVTEMRTAAASACAIRALVTKPPQVVCIVGTSVQARSHAEAVRALYPESKIRVWGRTPDRVRECAADINGTPYDSLPEALSGADVVITVTMATEPVVKGKWLKPGAVVCGVGACRPNWREHDDDVMQNAVVTVDSRKSAMTESGDVILSGVEIFAEIGEVMSGAVTLPQVPNAEKKFLFFKSLGIAIEDIVCGKLIYDKFIQRQKSED